MNVYSYINLIHPMFTVGTGRVILTAHSHSNCISIAALLVALRF